MRKTGIAKDVFVYKGVSPVEIADLEKIVRIGSVRRTEKEKRERLATVRNKYNNQQVWARTTGTGMARKIGFGKVKRQRK